MKRKKVTVAVLAILVSGFSPLLSPYPRVFAEEIVVSGNSNDSASNVTVVQQSDATVSQSNESNIQNNTTTTSDSGHNSASDNNGNVSVETGNISTDTSVSNQANVSIVDANTCCLKDQGSIAVSGNGAGSSNDVDVSNATTITTTTQQTATIVTNITGSAVTGHNRANDNQGDVTIVTGNINHTEEIKTGLINHASVTFGVPSNDYLIQIAGNGAGSVNKLTFSNNTVIHNAVINNANIFNNSFWELITGNNIASRNNGDVTIKTGDITSKISIENKANSSEITEKCCKIQPTQTLSPTPTPPTPTPQKEEGKPGGGGNGGGGGSSGGGQGGSSASAGSSAGNILPITGGNWLVFAILGNIIMLFFGVVLRLRSGRSPGFRYNFVL